MNLEGLKPLTTYTNEHPRSKIKPSDLPKFYGNDTDDVDDWIEKVSAILDEDVTESGEADTDAEEGDEEEDGMTCSPLSMIQRLGTYVHLSCKRRKVFMSLRKLHDSTEKIINLPRKDVATRWNSKYFAIKQAIRLKKTVLAFCLRYSEDPKCLALNEGAFEILDIILPSLHIFQAMTEEHPKAQVTVHRILPDLNFAIKEMTRLKDGSGITEARKKPFEVAIAKLEFYFYKFLNTDWVCCAYMLDPESRGSAPADSKHTKTINAVNESRRRSPGFASESNYIKTNQMRTPLHRVRR
ncbi:hypothetical protein QFC21_007316 [Naganishia friedmannii]|uniref:Uncharacterized protein n=1 Tax=Naganishia friedmannii TaxID=89922 RepID=A0ACC2UWR4_9TREE|nr:hypothetical protein QFC21_007316 [Naganishia friedmannii]